MLRSISLELGQREAVQAPAAAVVRSLGWGERRAKVAEKLLQTGHMPWEVPVWKYQVPVP